MLCKIFERENKEYYGIFEKGPLYPAVEAFQETTRAESMISQKPKPFKVRVSEVVPVQICKDLALNCPGKSPVWTLSES